MASWLSVFSPRNCERTINAGERKLELGLIYPALDLQSSDLGDIYDRDARDAEKKLPKNKVIPDVRAAEGRHYGGGLVVENPAYFFNPWKTEFVFDAIAAFPPHFCLAGNSVSLWPAGRIQP